MVYFIEAVGVDLMKIGFTERDVEQRLRELQTGNPHTLRVAAAMAGDLQVERELHAQFTHLRVNGEWFRIDAELRTFMAMVKWVFPKLAAIEGTTSAAVRDLVSVYHRLIPIEEAIRSRAWSVRAEASALQEWTRSDDDDPSQPPAGCSTLTDETRRRVLEEFRSASEMEAFLNSPRGRT